MSDLEREIEYFPAGAFYDRADADDFKREWYSSHLRSMHEPSLWELSRGSQAEFFRFLWIPTWQPPFAIRLDISSDGTVCIYGRLTSGRGGYGSGTVTQGTTRILNAEESSQFRKYLELAKFWELPAKEVIHGGCDGDWWIFEGVRNGKYHVVDRWCVGHHPLNDLGRYLLALSELPVPIERLHTVEMKELDTEEALELFGKIVKSPAKE